MWVSTSQQTHARPYRLLCQEMWETRLCYHNPHLCWVPEVPGECAKWVWGLPGRGDAAFGTEELPGQVMGLGWQGSGVILELPLPCCHPAWVLGATQGHHWQPKIISAWLGKALVSSLPFSLNKVTIRAFLINCCPQLMFLLRKFSEVLVLYSLRSVTSEDIWINSSVNHVCPQCSSHGGSFQALRAVDAQTLTQHHHVHH